MDKGVLVLLNVKILRNKIYADNIAINAYLLSGVVPICVVVVGCSTSECFLCFELGEGVLSNSDVTLPLRFKRERESTLFLEESPSFLVSGVESLLLLVERAGGWLTSATALLRARVSLTVLPSSLV